MTALERAVIEDSAIHLKALGFDPGRDDVDPLYDLAWGPNALRVLSTSREPKDWNPIATRTLSHYSTAINWRIGSITIEDVEAVFDLGAE
jgi:hypothetical protein